MKELKALYAAACQGLPWVLPPARRFSAYAAQQAQQQHSAQTRAAEAYWLGQFRDPVTPLALPTDRPRPALQTYAGARQEWHIGPTLQQALKTLSAQHGCTLFITLLAGFQALLHQLSGQDDIVVGIAAAEPAGASATHLLGYTTNLLPLRSRSRPGRPQAEQLQTVKQMVFDAYQHQSYSLLHLLDTLQLPQDGSGSPLIAALFNVDYAGSSPVLHDLEVEMFSPPSGAVECDIFWNITEADDGLWVEGYYNTDLFDGQTIRRWLEHYQAILADFVTP
jgi:non-ribosomal peptide synthetase component F